MTLTPTLNLRERLIRRIVLVVFPLVSASAAFAGVAHFLEDNPRSLNLVLPEVVSVVFIGLFVYVLRRPDGINAALWAAFITAIAALVLVSWMFTLEAARSTDVRLVDTLPSVTPVLLPTLMSSVLFMRARWVLVAVILGWALVALPVLVYLFVHPGELWTLRGLEVAMTLGPTMLLVLVLIPFFRGMDEIAHEYAKKGPAQRDPLTNLHDRRSGEELLKEFVDAADPNSGVIMFDLDFFKGVNDRHGRPAGDEVLKTVAERCAARLRRNDVFVRWGGEEFLVLIQGAPRKVVALVAEDLKNAIGGEPIAGAGRVTASFGVTQLRLMDSVDSLLGRVEEALVAAKKGGRNQVVES